MAEIEDFKKGERVAHITAGDGVVVAQTGRTVMVQFDSGAIGEYDRNWFEQHPNYLFHRSTP